MLTLNVQENVSGQSNDYLKGIVQEMRFYSQLQFRDVLSCDTLVVEFEQLFPNDKWIDINELLWEDHLAVSE